MTTREIFFKAVMMSELPVGVLTWACENHGIIEFNQVHLQFDKNHYDESIIKMKEIEDRQYQKFLFWTISPEGEKFIKDNAKEIGMALFGSLYIK